MADTHTVMPKKLAQALMEAGMQHFDAGGPVAPSMNPATQPGIAGTDSQQTMLNNSVGAGPATLLNPGGALGASMNLPTIGTMLQPLMNNYSASTPNISTQNFIPQIQGQQMNLGNALVQQQGVANGTGPNAALAQFNENTGKNIQSQAALMNSQRGASANPALIARQAAQQGGAMQQTATGQAATLQAQQQIAAQSAVANEALQAQSILQGGQAAQNTAITQGSLGAQGINANVSAQNANTMGNLVGGFTSGMSGAITSLLSKGGVVKKMAEGGPVDNSEVPEIPPVGGPVNDNVGIANYGSPGGSSTPAFYQAPATNPFASQGGKGGGGGGGGIASLAALLSKGGNVPGQMLAGGNVPGKAKVSGDSEKNDTVPTMLSPGEVVIPRSITESPDMEKKVIEFLKHLKSKKSGGYGAVAEAKRKRG